MGTGRIERGAAACSDVWRVQGDDLPNLGVVQMIRAVQHSNRAVADEHNVDVRMRERIGELIAPLSPGVFHAERLANMRREAEVSS